MRILVTGSSGFVGGAFGRHAARAGHEVLGVGRASQPAHGWPGRYAQADVSTSDLSELIASFGPEVLLHAAGTAAVAPSFKHPLDDLRASVLTWANVLDAVRRAGARPLVVFPSSAAVYGAPASLPAREDAPARPISPYGFHKAACEMLAREYAECFRLRLLVCRLFSVFGETQRRLLVWELYRRLSAPGQEAWLEGTGDETRDYLHVEDAAAAMLASASALAARSEEEGDLSSEAGGLLSLEEEGALHVVNVAGGEETRVLDLALRLRALVAPDKEVRCRGAERAGDPPRWLADTSALRALAPGFRPRPLAERLAQCVRAWKEEDARLADSGPRTSD